MTTISHESEPSGRTSVTSHTKFKVSQSVIDRMVKASNGTASDDAEGAGAVTGESETTISKTEICATHVLILGQIAESLATIATKCCAPAPCGAKPGALCAGGQLLTDYLDGLQVETRWLAGHHIIWQTGQRDSCKELPPAGHTHCSAFVAAAAHGISVYVLRPPAHSQIGLANAQMDWLCRAHPYGHDYKEKSASDAGWRSLGRSNDPKVLESAVAAANCGKLVIAGYRQPSTKDTDTAVIQGPGHVVIVRPQADKIQDDGPQVIMAGLQNRQSISMQHAFKDHDGAWPNHIQLFVHDTVLE